MLVMAVPPLAQGLTATVSLPVMPVLLVSAAMMVWLPAVSRVALKVWTPLSPDTNA